MAGSKARHRQMDRRRATMPTLSVRRSELAAWRMPTDWWSALMVVARSLRFVVPYGQEHPAPLFVGGALLLVHGADLTAEQRARIPKLENSLLAPCCHSEVVARHNSEV